jgi:uncharacterized protein DUF4153
MSKTTEVGLCVLGGALVLGIIADALLGPAVPGVNVVLCVLALAAVVAALARRQRVAVTGEGRWLLLPAVFFGAAFAWRDSPTLQFLNGLALIVALALAALRARSGQIRVAGVTDYLLGVGAAGLQALTGHFPLLFREIQWKEIPRGRGYGTVFAVGRGVAIALPLLLLFGGLFASADAVFDQMVQRLFHWDLNSLASHLVTIGLYTLVAAGILRLTLSAGEWKGPERERFSRFSLGIVEAGIVLGLLNLLFLAFVHIQFRYLFGGAALVRIAPGLTYAEYARHGFFELVTVAILVLPLLLLMHWLLRKENHGHELLYRGLAVSLLAMLFVIMASAVQRMLLYQDAYGMTELRFYTTAFMGWLAVVALWFAATVLRGKRERFAWGVLVTAFLAIGLLDRLNPDACIVRANVARAMADRSFDERYITSLSADAVPALVEGLPALGEAKRRAVAQMVLTHWSPPAERDWRAWNWDRARAWRVVDRHRTDLRYATPPAGAKGALASVPPSGFAAVPGGGEHR